MDTPVKILRVNSCGQGVRASSLIPRLLEQSQNWFFFVQDGNLRYLDDENECILIPNHFYILPFHKRFFLTEIENVEFNHLFVSFNCSQPIEKFVELDISKDVFLTNLLQLIIQHYKSLDNIELGTLLETVLYHVLPQHESTQELAVQIKQYIEKTLPVFDMQDVCAHFHYGKRYLDLKFKNAYGISITKYAQNERFSFVAKALLTGKSLAEICEIIKYSSPANLSRDFRKHYGIPPSQYRTPVDFIR